MALPAGVVLRGIDDALHAMLLHHGGGSRRARCTVIGQVRNESFTLRLRRAWVGGEVDALELRGDVTAEAGEIGCAVQATVGEEHVPGAAPIVFVAVAVLIAFTNGAGFVELLAFAILVAAFGMFRARRNDRDSPDSTCLVQWLDDVLSGLEQRP